MVGGGGGGGGTDGLLLLSNFTTLYFAKHLHPLAQALPRPFFNRVTVTWIKQRLSKVWAQWLKLTANWPVSLSEVTWSSSILQTRTRLKLRAPCWSINWGCCGTPTLFQAIKGLCDKFPPPPPQSIPPFPPSLINLMVSVDVKHHVYYIAKSELAVRLVSKWKGLGLIPLWLSFLFKKVVVCGHCLWLCPSLPTETLKWLSLLPILMQESFWWWQCSDRYIIFLSPHLQVSVDVKHHVYLLIAKEIFARLTLTSWQTYITSIPHCHPRVTTSQNKQHVHFYFLHFLLCCCFWYCLFLV